MKVLVLGCGWIGNIFADQLLKLGYAVYATTTSPNKMEALKEKGITAFLIDFNQPQSPEDYTLNHLSFDLVLISVPAKKKEMLATCLHKFKNLSSFLQKITYHCAVYLSSTGIYPYVDYPIEEENIPIRQLDEKLYQVEQLLSSHNPSLNILRLGGIFGYNRIPGKHFSGKNCPVANQPANYIHADDICAVILTIVRQELKHQLFNVVSPKHPLKKELIIKMARKYNYELPLSFQDTMDIAKIVSSKKLTDTLSYTFIYANPLDY